MTSESGSGGVPGAEGLNRSAVSDRLRDKLLWGLWAFAALAVVAYFVARHYYFEEAAFDCFPACTTKQDLANSVYGGALWVAGLLVLASVVRWVMLGRRR